MRKNKRLFVTVLAVLACILMASSFNKPPAMAKSSKIPTKVTIVNTKNQSISKKTVTVGDKFELDAQVNAGAEDDYLKWKIVSGKRVVKFVGDEKYGDEAELKALKAGKAKIQVYVNGKAVKDTITITVKKATSNGEIRAKGSKIKCEEVHDDFDLEVIKSKPSMKESQLEWSIADKTIVDFAGGRKTGHEVEFYAKKIGRTKITCKYVVKDKVKSKITFAVKVVRDDSRQNPSSDSEDYSEDYSVPDRNDPAQPQGISLEQAMEAALLDANLSEEEVTFTKAEIDDNGRVKVYDIEFYTSDREYDYEINAYDGTVHEKSVEEFHIQPGDSTENNSGNSGNQYIGVNQAKKIALSHANLSEADVQFTKAKLEKDDGKMEYEIEFYFEKAEYSYTVDAVSGDILEYDVDFD